MKDKIIGYTSGVFDLFHIGHLNILKNSKGMCDELIVGIATDDYAFRLKGKYPVIPYAEREEIIASIRYVDRVCSHNIDSLDQDVFIQHILELQKQLGFHKYFKGSDVENFPEWVELKAELAKRGVQMIFLPYTKTTSSTLLVKKLGEY